MYYYIVDPQKLSQKEFERVQNVLYSSLSEYKISGEVVRITGLRSVPQLVENAFSHDVTTLVAVGGDDTLHQMINSIGKREVVVGFIPVVASEIGNILGLRDIPQAVKTIASRRIQDLDLGVINGNYFFSKISFGLNQTTSLGNFFHLPTFEIKFSADHNFQATQQVIGGIIINSRQNQIGEKKIGDPTDGVLDVLLLSELSKWNAIRYRNQIRAGYYESLPRASLIHAKQLEILAPINMPLKIGDQVMTRTPASITVATKFLRMIVAKDRSF